MAVVKSVNDVNEESLAAIVKAHLKDEQVDVTDVELRQKFDVGENGQTGFCSNMKGATVKYRIRGDSDEHEIHIAFKLPPTNWVRHLSKMGCLYVHETLWYTK